MVAGRCEIFDVNYIGNDDPIPDFHSMSVFAYKRKDPFEFEREFRLALMLPAKESVWIDKEEDYGRILKVAPKDFIDEVRFHPDATDAFRVLVRADLAAAGFDVSIRDAESPLKG